MSKQPNGIVIYRGPSVLDGAPIIVIATGMAKKSSNGKTGSLIQTWILREDVNPAEAVKTGQDSSICGGCVHRGPVKPVKGKRKRSCYVRVAQAPLVVWKAFHRGIYPVATESELAALFAGRRVRAGAYGDPAAVPFGIWAAVMSEAEAWTGYTHQWRTCDSRFAQFLMASCETGADYLAAKKLGYRTFRVRLPDDATFARELPCPASKEAGAKTTCAKCIACGGNGAKTTRDITIVAHGASWMVNAYREIRAAA